LQVAAEGAGDLDQQHPLGDVDDHRHRRRAGHGARRSLVQQELDLGPRAFGVEAQHHAVEGLHALDRQHPPREFIHAGHVAVVVEVDHADIETFEQVQRRYSSGHDDPASNNADD